MGDGKRLKGMIKSVCIYKKYLRRTKAVILTLWLFGGGW